jgi:hypothetical protein
MGSIVEGSIHLFLDGLRQFHAHDRLIRSLPFTHPRPSGCCNLCRSTPIGSILDPGCWIKTRPEPRITRILLQKATKQTKLRRSKPPLLPSLPSVRFCLRGSAFTTLSAQRPTLNGTGVQMLMIDPRFWIKTVRIADPPSPRLRGQVTRMSRILLQKGNPPRPVDCANEVT